MIKIAFKSIDSNKNNAAVKKHKKKRFNTVVDFCVKLSLRSISAINNSTVLSRVMTIYFDYWLTEMIDMF